MSGQLVYYNCQQLTRLLSHLNFVVYNAYMYFKMFRIKSLQVLLIGMQGLGAEIAKNLILSGIQSIVLKDHTDTSMLDICSQFLIPRNSQERNVSVEVDLRRLETLSFFSVYHIQIVIICIHNLPNGLINLLTQ